MSNNFTPQQVNADVINSNFSGLQGEIETKADLNGDSTQKFKVADAVELTEAINKGQLDGSISTVNTSISTLETEVATKADKTYVDTNLVLKANTSDVDAVLATKIDVNDATVTKQGNTFNEPGQLVQLDSNGKLPAIDGSLLTGINYATLSTVDMPTLSNNAIDANNDIDFSSGFCWDDTLTIKIISTAATKQLDAIWANGTQSGGLDICSKAASTWYHCFAIAKADGTSDFLFSTSVSNPIMPNGYIYKRRLGSIQTASNGNIIQFYQDNNTFYFQTPIQVINSTNPGTSAVIVTLPLPLGIKVKALINLSAFNGYANNYYTIISSLYQNDIAPSNSYHDSSVGNADISKSVLTSTLGQIRYRINYSDSNTKVTANIDGYEDKRMH